MYKSTHKNRTEALLPEEKMVSDIAHQLRQPVFSIHASTENLGEAIDAVNSLMRQHQEALPREFNDQLSQLINEELNPSVKLLFSTLSDLNTQIDSFSMVVAQASIEGDPGKQKDQTAQKSSPSSKAPKLAAGERNMAKRKRNLATSE